MTILVSFWMWTDKCYYCIQYTRGKYLSKDEAEQRRYKCVNSQDLHTANTIIFFCLCNGVLDRLNEILK